MQSSIQKRLTSFISPLHTRDIHGGTDPVITGLSYDSRRVSPGYLFFALSGLHVDGHRFIGKAVDAGAVAVIHEKEPDEYRPGVAYIRVDDSRQAMSMLSSSFHDHPSEKLTMIGVTGTDGKSSTVSFIHQLLVLADKKAGFLSTVQFDTGTGGSSNHLRQSTPESPEVHELLHDMVLNGCEYAVVEATSHGLSPKTSRLRDVRFDTAVVTNISHEHLEFHGSFEQYRQDKSELFKKAGAGNNDAERPRCGIINLDDENAPFFLTAAEESGLRTFTYSMEREDADCRIMEYSESGDSIDFTMIYQDEALSSRLAMTGRFNLENFMAAFLAAAESAGIPPEKLAADAEKLRPVEGRMNSVICGQPFRVIVDYAHTPNSFSAIFPQLRDQTKGRLIAVFGSAGERDVEKRPIQGAIADRYCDCVILTDEDPREEQRETILQDIAGGCTGKIEGRDLFLIPDRRKAIEAAFRLARKDDTVVLLGKGHEKSIIYSDGPLEWNETETAAACLTEMGFSPE